MLLMMLVGFIVMKLSLVLLGVVVMGSEVRCEKVVFVLVFLNRLLVCDVV